MERIIGGRNFTPDLSDPWGNGLEGVGDESGGTAFLLTQPEEVLAAFEAAQSPRCQAHSLRIRANASVPGAPWGFLIEGVGDESAGSALIAAARR